MLSSEPRYSDTNICIYAIGMNLAKRKFEVGTQTCFVSSRRGRELAESLNMIVEKGEREDEEGDEVFMNDRRRISVAMTNVRRKRRAIWMEKRGYEYGMRIGESNVKYCDGSDEGDEGDWGDTGSEEGDNEYGLEADEASPSGGKSPSGEDGEEKSQGGARGERARGASELHEQGKMGRKQ